MNVSPSIRRVATLLWVKHIIRRKVSSFVYPGNKRTWILENSPTLFCKHSKVEILEIAKAHSLSKLWFTHLFLAHPSYFWFLLSLSPPEISHHPFKIITKTFRQLEVAHGVSQYGLGYHFDENFFTPDGQNFLFPTYQLLPHILFNFNKHLHFWLPNDWGEARVFFMSWVLHWSQDTQDLFFGFLEAVGTVEHRWFVSVDFLPIGRFVALMDVNKFLTFLSICFAK